VPLRRDRDIGEARRRGSGQRARKDWGILSSRLPYIRAALFVLIVFDRSKVRRDRTDGRSPLLEIRRHFHQNWAFAERATPSARVATLYVSFLAHPAPLPRSSLQLISRGDRRPIDARRVPDPCHAPPPALGANMYWTTCPPTVLIKHDAAFRSRMIISRIQYPRARPPRRRCKVLPSCFENLKYAHHRLLGRI
jgi:hypothetical protein